MIDPSNIKFLQVEATTKCNAWCPGCARSNDGFKVSDKLTINDLSINRLAEVLEQLPNLEIIDFCGTYGDAIASPDIIDLVSLSTKFCKKIVIRTNGSLRTTSWWANLANILNNIDHEVWFCLDGLEDTHSIYRQATDWKTIINNAISFINNKGTAVWQFIPFSHNEHQIKDCIRLSQKLGFKRFEFYKDVRLDFEPKNYKSGESYIIRPWSENNRMSKYVNPKSEVDKKNCRHLQDPSLYLNANGTLSTCCFFNIHRSSNNIENLPDIEAELITPHKNCLHHCGSQGKSV